MKKIFVIIFSFMIMLCGGGAISLGVLSSSAEEVTNDVRKITSAEEYLEVMTDETIYGNKDVVVRLESDINLDGVDLGGVFTVNGQFMGTFDGNGFTISNPTFNSNTQYFGLIPQASGATIRDVRVNGRIEYVFTQTNVKELYVGGIVGSGVNVNFLNCELDNVVGEGEKAQTYNIELPIYSNVNFGGLAGRVRYDLAGNNDATIKDCINYYSINLNMVKDTSVNVGGLIGSIENGSILNALYAGSINITNNVSTSSPIGQVGIGGIVGGIGGTKAAVRNSLFGGSIVKTNSVLNLNLYTGGIVGSKLSTIRPTNVNFVYYTDANLKPSGDNSISQSEKVARIERIDRDFMTNDKNFDPATMAFDFEKVWSLTNSVFHLQNFQLFDFTFNNILDNGRILDSANFIINEGSPLKRVSAKYDEEVVIEINFKEENFGYYVLSLVYNLNGKPLSSNEYILEETNEDGVLVGYKIHLKANAVTAGVYSFSISPKAYTCIATIADEANIKDDDGNIIDHQGGILIDNGSTPLFDPVSIPFYRDSKSKTIIASGQDIYVFDHWVMFVKDEEGNFTKEVELEQSEESSLVVSFGTAPFDKEFKLVAYFTKNAVNVSFIKSNLIKSITFGGKTYAEEALPISPTAVQSLIVVIEKGYVIDTDTFERDVKAMYGSSSSNAPVFLSSETNEETGETTYRFSINMRNIGHFDNNELKLSFLINEDKSDGMSSLLWLYIMLPVVAVVAGVIIAVVIIMKKRRAGDDDSIGGSSSSGGKVKAKKESYKDLY